MAWVLVVMMALPPDFVPVEKRVPYATEAACKKARDATVFNVDQVNGLMIIARCEAKK